jgi:hypothetical protein
LKVAVNVAAKVAPRATPRLLLSTALIALSLFAVPGRAAATTAVALYVDATSTFGGSDCSAPAPCPTITDALAVAAGDAGAQVIVSIAPGTYPESITLTPPASGSLFLQGAGAGATAITGALEE